MVAIVAVEPETVEPETVEPETVEPEISVEDTSRVLAVSSDAEASMRAV
mgnify:CR=1 FL=1